MIYLCTFRFLLIFPLLFQSALTSRRVQRPVRPATTRSCRIRLAPTPFITLCSFKRHHLIFLRSMFFCRSLPFRVPSSPPSESPSYRVPYPLSLRRPLLPWPGAWN